MATLTQLRTETWWDREITTPELDALADELCRRTGRPRTAAGTKGNAAHLRGAHRSQEWILRSRYCTNRTYTVQSGLTADQARYVAGLDFVPGTWGTANNRSLVAEQTGRLMTAMKAGELDGVRELFGTLDGRRVAGWNNITNRPASSDASHLEHWHLTLDRRRLRDRALMERILTIALGEETDMFGDEDRKLLRDLHWAVGRGVPGGPNGREALTWGWPRMIDRLDALLAQAGIDPAELDAIREAAREGAASAADDLVAAVMAQLPPGQLTPADVEAAVRDAFADGLAPDAGVDGISPTGRASGA